MALDATEVIRQDTCVTTLLRIATAFIAIVVVGTSLAWLLWHLAYPVESGPPDEAIVEGLDAESTVFWGKEGDARIRAESESDAIAALGFVHAHARAWSATVWRQAALGRLTEWLGPSAIAADRLTRRLGLADTALETYAGLEADDRRLLGAYAAGFNAGLEGDGAQLRKEFVLIGHTAEPWLEWHTLAIERLVAWLATTPPSPEELARMGPRASDFYDDDLALRELLRLHGFQNSIAWSSNGTVFQRQVHGDGELSPYLETAVHIDGGPRWLGASLPGTFFFPVGRSDSSSWAVLLSSGVAFDHVPWRADSATIAFDRVATPNLSEHLVVSTRIGRQLAFLPLGAPDSAWVLEWAGFDAASDLAAWGALWAGNPQPFGLLEGHGLFDVSPGRVEILGAPAMRRRSGPTTFVGLSPWAHYVAEHMSRQDSVRIDAWLDGAYSVWAETTAPPLISIAEGAADPSEGYLNVLPFLKNWDFRYRGSSIAASVFEVWVRITESKGGAPPAVDVWAALEEAVDTLSARFGPDQSMWRWELTHPDRRHFAVASAEGAPTEDRYAPIDRPGHGHASSLAWGATPATGRFASPAAFVAWFPSGSLGAMHVRKHRLDADAPLGRYFYNTGRAATVLFPSPTVSTTRLVAQGR